MQKRLFAIFLFSLFKGMSSYCVKVVDPLTLTLEQLLSDITLEILPCPFYPPYPECQTCPDYPTYPSYPSPCTSCTPSYPPYPYPIDQCYPDYPISYYPIEFELTIPPCPTCLDLPYEMDYLPRSCFRDVKDPCIICENPAPLSICFECGCPIYFPEVEYPTSALDFRPYYYGNCWCT